MSTQWDGVEFNQLFLFQLNEAGVKSAEVNKKVVKEARQLLRDNPDIVGDTKRQLQIMALDDTPLDSNLVR